MTTKGFYMKLHLAAAAALSLVAGGLLVSPASGANGSVEIVTEGSVTRQAEDTPPTDNWVLYTRSSAVGSATAAFVDGPETPPMGRGSLQMVTGNYNDHKVWLFNYDHVGARLADVADVSYGTYRPDGSTGVVLPALNIEVDYNGADPGGYTVLVYEPYLNAAQGPIVNGDWQSWDAKAGKWWSSQNIPAQNVVRQTTLMTWSDILTKFPDAEVLGGVGVNLGSYNPNSTGYADAFTFDTTTYDFENLTKADCKKGGWATMSMPFKNQGDCVSYFAAGK